MEPRVLVVHSGSRHAYALPAAFAEAGMLEAFYTDMCAGRGLGRLAGAALPGSLGRRLAGRRPPPAVLARTRTNDLDTLRYELKARRLRDPTVKRLALMAHAERAGRTLAGWGTGQATHLFNVLGEGGALCHMAHDKGLTVLSDIIIALSTGAIQEAEYEAFPDWGPPPPRTDMRRPETLLTTTDLFVCPSPFVADDLVARWGVDRAATRIVPYALSEAWFAIEPRPVRGRVLFAGTADRRKGIHYFAMAADVLKARSKPYTFHVAGNAPEAVREHKGAKALTFLGRVPRATVGEQFAAADLFVLPTLAEGSATVIYEAMAAGLPVITTRAAGSVITDGVDGIIVPERDPDALAAAIERVLEDRPLRERLATAARARAAGFGWQRYAADLVALVRGAGRPDAVPAPCCAAD